MSASRSAGHGQPYFFFDFISPFSYLLLEQHDKWPAMPFEITPVELYKLLDRWGQPHAATIPSKRVFTYRHALFRAEQLGIPFRMPPVHPFDPGKALRLAVAAGSEIGCIREIYPLHLARRTRSVDARGLSRPVPPRRAARWREADRTGGRQGQAAGQ